MRSKDIDNLENILLDLEDVENGAMISLSQGEINSLESILETLKESISKDKIKKFIKDELPDDEEMELCTIVDVNGIELRKKLEGLLEEK